MPFESPKRAAAALLIGIGDYRRSDRVQRLAYAANDAKAMARLFVDPRIGGFSKDHVVLLTDRRARRNSIVHRLSKWLPEQAKGAEIAVIFFAGHGIVHKIGDKEQGYLLPYDADPEDIVTDGVAMSDLATWIGGIEAQAVVVFLDCCHAGKVIFRDGATPRSGSRGLVLGPSAFQGLAGRRRFLIASCDEGQKSLEVAELHHGLFTYYLLRGLAGAGDSNRDGKVEVAELFNYVAGAVAQEAHRRFGVEQKPWSSATWAEHVYLSAPGTVDDTDITLPPADSGADDEERTISILRALRSKRDTSAVPFIFHSLAHRSEAVRLRAKKAVQAIGWEKTVLAVEALAQRADEKEMGFIFEGLTALEADAEVIGLLDRLVLKLKAPLWDQALRLLEHKRLSLEREKVATLFQEIRCPYQIKRVLGQGLFTAAYLAHDEHSGLDVVIRLLRPEFVQQPQIRAQFLEVSKKSMRYIHEKLVPTREVRQFPERNIYYTVRDYIAGVTLRDVLAKKKFEPLQGLAILRQVLQGLGPIHRDGGFHGGIKPSNIFLGPDDRVVLGDPSLPVLAGAMALDRLAYDYRYLPPELFRSGEDLGPRSDFYALGCVAYELSCGQPPFVSNNHHELVVQHASARIVPPSEHAGPWYERGDGLILRLLARSPLDRFATIDEVLCAMETLERTLQQSKQPVRILRDASLADYEAVAQSVIGLQRRDPLTAASFPNLDHDIPAAETSEPTTGVAAGESIEPVGPLPELPSQLGRYQIIKILGKGGMGAVYQARDTQLDRMVALKVHRLPASHSMTMSEQRMLRQDREGRAAARFRHPNICPLYDIGETEGIFYMVMAYIEGRTLRDVLQERGPLPIAEAVALVGILALAIDHAHGLGVVHRDLKPGNIMMDEQDQPVIMDFGLARLREEVNREMSQSTLVGQIVGTPAYMSPEQASGDVRSIGPATDIFSLGVILYELLTGARPFEGSPWELLHQTVSIEPSPPSKLRSEIPSGLDAICLRCLHKDPQKRYLHARELAEDLSRFAAASPSCGSELSRSIAVPNETARPFWKQLIGRVFGR